MKTVAIVFLYAIAMLLLWRTLATGGDADVQDPEFTASDDEFVADEVGIAPDKRDAA